MTEISKQPETPNIIETVRGRKGRETVYYPLGPDGKPLIPSVDPTHYNKKGEIQTVSETKGTIVDTEA